VTDADAEVGARVGVIPLVTSFGAPEPAPFSSDGAEAPVW
jgi:hypothetical protein